MPAILEIHVAPVGTSSASMGDLVARTVAVAKQRGVKYRVNPMGTTLEGDLDTLFSLARAMHEAAFTAGTPRVLTSIRIDDRLDKDLTMDYKVDSVLAKLGDKP
jgi:uncharacterized protein (TIGR00106 family)